MSDRIPDGLIVLTFDDGIKSQFTFAAPLLSELGFGATFYITEGLNFLTSKERYLTWEEVKDLHDQGFEIGNHTRNHRNVKHQSADDLMADIEHIDTRCDEFGISKPTTFCYPGYANSPEAVEVLRKRGFDYARRGTDPEYPYDRGGGRGPAFDPSLHDPLLVPATGVSGPNWNEDDFHWAVDQAVEGRIAVLTFHGVPEYEHPWVHTPPNVFESYMRHLSRNGCTVIALRDLDLYLN